MMIFTVAFYYSRYRRWKRTTVRKLTRVFKNAAQNWRAGRYQGRRVKW